MRHLGGAVKLEHVARRVVARNGAAGFQRHAGMPPDRQRRRDDGVRGAESGIDVAIALAHDRGFGRPARLEFAGLVVGMQDRRQFLDVERDKLGCILGEIRIVGENRRHRFADIAHEAARKEPLAIRLQPLDAAETKIDRRNVGDVGGRPHRVHAGQRQRSVGIDRAQPAVREIRTHDAHMQLLRKRNIGGKAAAAGQQRPVLQAGQRAARHIVFLALRLRAPSVSRYAPLSRPPLPQSRRRPHARLSRCSDSRCSGKDWTTARRRARRR